MESRSTVWAEVNEQGHLVLPAEVAARYGLRPGARVRLDTGQNDVRLHRPVSHLAKVYVESTNLCNIACRTCMRNIWDEPLGRMRAATFERILASLAGITPRPTVFFGGLGEPLFHPRTPAMIAQAKAAGAFVELITNGTLLTEKRAHQLIDAGLDRLWVSLDGARPESYADVRLGATLSTVLDNVARLQHMRPGGHFPRPEIGIAFVAMARNVADLPEILNIARRLRAKRVAVSNVLPYTDELRSEVLYTRAISDITYTRSAWVPHLSLPKMDFNDTTREAFFEALRSGYNVNFAGYSLGETNDACQFVEGGAMAVGWDGSVSPCFPLLHTHVSWLKGRQRASQRHVLGAIAEHSLIELWNDPEYVAYRERVQRFAFAPCASCGGCELAEANQEDCIGNTFPACGGCLWAQGVIQCP
jgi:MoaA/NifB/PqqE/SkfB family radical SAM enzyme